MRFPAIHDTIAACSTAPGCSAAALLRISGPDAFPIVAQLGVESPAIGRDPITPARIQLDGIDLPVRLAWFRAPHSYTGDDLVELTTIGCAPVMALLRERLFESGARAALPGEYSARAYLAGKLALEQVEQVAGWIGAGRAAALRTELRQLDQERTELEAVSSNVLELLARIEAGIDFTDEEDVRFISGAAAHAKLLGLERRLSALTPSDDRAGLPHIALVGLPNAGKSTLLNWLAAAPRAITSDMAGTTRDALQAQAQIGLQTLVLTDSAGFAPGGEVLERAAHSAAQRTAARADLLLFVHDASQPWTANELELLDSYDAEQTLIVISKSDLSVGLAPRECPSVAVSAQTDTGRAALEAAIQQRLQATPPALRPTEITSARACLQRAAALVAEADEDLPAPDLLAYELRSAFQALEHLVRDHIAERVLDWIYGQFCVGK